MREIKFRIWYSKIKNMCYEPYDYINFNGKVGTYDNLFGFEELEDDYVLMQYTGLTDKNNVEIYEGDILGLKDKINNNYTDLVEIKWDIDGCCFIADWFDECLTLDLLRTDYEVIGNIYENKELLRCDDEN